MYKCNKCGYTTLRWLGQCPKCGLWGTFEEVLEQSDDSPKRGRSKKREVLDIVDSSKRGRAGKLERYSTGFEELDRILGGGLVQGGVLLLGGEPGIGKSTLVMQIFSNLASKGVPVLYVSAEESLSQVLARGARLKAGTSRPIKIATSDNIADVLNDSRIGSFKFIALDSIQAFLHPDVDGVSGGISQLRKVVSEVTRFAKKNNIGVVSIGQVTKAGLVSGPKLVEHIVDTVLYLENFGIEDLRIIRAVKNRFGPVGDLGFLKMTNLGFVDAKDAASSYLDTSIVDAGAAFGVSLYGTRPLVVQFQALINDAQFAAPRKVAEGVSKNKIELLAAVINQKMPGVSLQYKDLFVKAIGGLTLKDSGIDLAIVASIVSAATGKVFNDTVFIGEVGLLGEVKPCLALEARIKEAKKFGFKKIISSKNLRHIAELKSYLN